MAISRGLVRAIALAVGVTATARAADVKVTQGPPPEKFLHSPMLLEMPLQAGAETAGTWVNLDDFDAYQCDFVRVRRIATRLTLWEERIDVGIKVYTFTEPSRDKAVRMEFRLFRDDEMVGFAVIPHIEAEERKRGYGTATLTVPRDRWPGEGSLVMKITVHVKND